MHKYLAALGIAVISAVGATPASAAILVNGDFEQPGGGYHRDLMNTATLNGWTYYNPTGSTDLYESSMASGLATVDGGHYVSFGHNGSYNGSISQTFATVVGQAYTLSYLVAQQQGTDASQVLRATISDGFQTLSADNTTAANSFAAGAGLSFTAMATSATLTFLDATAAGGGGVSNLALDNVSIDARQLSTGVPEPATWAMMIVGFGLVGSMSRTRRLGSATA